MDPLLLEPVDERAGGLPSHVAEDEVAAGLGRGTGEVGDVRHAGVGAQPLEDLRRIL